MRRHKSGHRRSSGYAASNRIPPSIPKCLAKNKNGDGYVTDAVDYNRKKVRFRIVKYGPHYLAAMNVIGETAWLEMKSSAFSPAVRAAFTDLTTMKSAVDAIEKFLNAPLPDIR